MDLITAVIHNDAKQVEQCLLDGADPNYCLDSANVTPLHFAAQHNSVDVVDLLITAGAKLYARTVPDGQTPFDTAKLNGHEDIAAIFEDYMRKIPFEQ